MTQLQIASHSSGEDNKAAYLYCGGKASSLKDAKRALFENAIITQFALRLTEDDIDNVDVVDDDKDVVDSDTINLDTAIEIPNQINGAEIGEAE